MAVTNLGWYARNALTAYPLHDAATGEADDGVSLPTDILVDAKILYPEAAGAYPFLASVSVSPGLVTLTFECSADPEARSGFSPLAVVSVPRARLNVYGHVAVEGQVPGVGGWVVFGQGAVDRPGYRGRFSTPAQGRLAPRAARAYRPLPVTGVGDVRAAAPLTGVVRLRADPPLAVEGAVREIAGVTRQVAVVRLAGDPTAPTFAVPEAARLAVAPADDNLFLRFAGPCAGRPESRTCGDPQPVEFVNNVAPDCAGVVTIDVRGCATVSRLAGGHGFVIDCGRGLSDACLAARIPAEDGTLPTETPPVYVPPVGPPPPPVVPPPPPGESVSDVGGLPYTACFDDGLIPADFTVAAGGWAADPDDTAAEHPYCHPGHDGSMSVDLSYGSVYSPSAGVKSVLLWDGFDVSTLGRTVRAAVKMTGGPVGARRNAGLVVNYRPHDTNPGQVVYHLAEVDHDAQQFRLRRFNGTNFQTVASVAVPGLVLGGWYEVACEVAPGAPGSVFLTATLARPGTGLAVTVGPVAVNTLLPATGRFGLHADRAVSKFSYLRVELTP